MNITLNITLTTDSTRERHRKNVKKKRKKNYQFMLFPRVCGEFKTIDKKPTEKKKA